MTTTDCELTAVHELRPDQRIFHRLYPGYLATISMLRCCHVANTVANCRTALAGPGLGRPGAVAQEKGVNEIACAGLRRLHLCRDATVAHQSYLCSLERGKKEISCIGTYPASKSNWLKQNTRRPLA